MSVNFHIIKKKLTEENSWTVILMIWIERKDHNYRNERPDKPKLFFVFMRAHSSQTSLI